MTTETKTGTSTGKWVADLQPGDLTSHAGGTCCGPDVPFRVEKTDPWPGGAGVDVTWRGSTAGRQRARARRQTIRKGNTPVTNIPSSQPARGRRRRRAILMAPAATAAALLAGCAASGAPAAAPSTGQADPWVAAATAYIARHPAPPRPGMTSGILIGEDTIVPGACPAVGKCWSWTGTVVVAGGRLVHIGSDGGNNCPGQPGWTTAGGERNVLLGAYLYFPVGSAPLCPPAGVVIIRASAITSSDAAAQAGAQ